MALKSLDGAAIQDSPAIEISMERPTSTDSAKIYNRIITASKEHGIDPNVALGIAKCESDFKQYSDDGQVIRGAQNHNDVGIFQINEQYHLDRSEKLGFNLYSTEGNIAYAMYLMKKEGTRHWNWSKPCWGKNQTLADSSK